MNRLVLRSITSAITLGLSVVARLAAADDRPPLAGPSLETDGKPLNPPAPTSATPKLVGVSGYGGAMVLDMGPLNDRLTGNSNNGVKLPLVFPILGGQGFGLFGHFLIGGSGTGLLARSVDGADGSKISASGAWGTFDFGYQLLRVNGFLVAPVLSLGGYGMDVTVDSKADASFNDALQTHNRGASLTSHGFLGGVSLVAKTIVIGRNAHVADARSGWALGLRLGGLYGIPYKGWKSDGATINGGPTFGLRGAFAALSIGAGTW